MKYFAAYKFLRTGLNNCPQLKTKIIEIAMYKEFKDEMTPKERMTAFAKGQPIDRLPVVPDMGVTMAGFLGHTTNEYYTDSDVIAETEIALFERFRHDSVGVSTTLRGMAEAMGSVLNYPHDSITNLKEPAVKTEADIEKLAPVNPNKDGKLPILLEALCKIRDRIGDVADIGASMTAPFTVAASVLGTEVLLRWMVKKPEALHRLMKIITANNREYIKALGKLGFSTGFCDPVSSTSVIKLKHYREFSLPYFRENVQDVITYCNSHPTVHICGKSRELWEDVMETGIGNFSIDNCEDLTEAKNIMGHKVMITGNVPPVDALYLGNEEIIRKAVRYCVQKGWDNTCGYILCTGCQIPKGTKIENIDAFMKWGRYYAHMPMEQSRFDED